VVSSRRVLALFAAASISCPLSWESCDAEERDALAAPVGEAVRSAIQARLSEKSPTGREQRAVVDYYSSPEVRLLWVDEHGLSLRAKILEEIAKADDYGLRSSAYELPKPDGFEANNPAPTNWLAERRDQDHVGRTQLCPRRAWRQVQSHPTECRSEHYDGTGGTPSGA
jgi:hypothetical protein